ncbi:alpha/beta fold hydrolase [Thalassovita aquimarina]|uniref:alpha/beta fold hydrolase n=1 Tax=Thalassovita aquimarina TaxID=2785917 RepID=UPI00356A718E
MVSVVRPIAYAFAALLLLLAASMATTGSPGRAVLLVLAAVAVSPALGHVVQRRGGQGRAILRRAAIIIAALGAFGFITASNSRDSIYASQEIRDRFHAMYREKLADWPAPYVSVSAATDYGTVHVLVSGPTDGPPMLLLHASGVGSWSWYHNIGALSGPYRTYAIDLIGDAGLSEYDTLRHRMKNGRDQAEHYSAIMDHFGIDRAVVVGASEGGFIATYLALHHPERVSRMILLGPMGYSGAVGAIVRITLTQMFPFRWLQDATFRWAFSDDEGLRTEYAQWFPLLMEGVFPQKVAPLPFSAEERQRVTVPTMFVFGMRDNLVGDVEKARALVQDMPDVTVETVEAGHLMDGEVPETIDRLILEFAARDRR